MGEIIVVAFTMLRNVSSAGRDSRGKGVAIPKFQAEKNVCYLVLFFGRLDCGGNQSSGRDSCDL